MKPDDATLAAEIDGLRRTLRILRGESGCAWDRERTLDDIISNLVEETYELLHAERAGDIDGVEEELGDVLFLVVFAHELLLERVETPLSAIVSRVHRKIVSRHPHVFGDEKADTAAESQAAWDRAKRRERAGRPPGGLLDGIPHDLPPLRRADAVQRIATAVGFDWPDIRGIVGKIREESDELLDAVLEGDRAHVKEELGDLLFTVIHLAGRLDADPEGALATTTAKFADRFRAMESAAAERGRDLESMEIDEMESLWQAAKRKKGER